MIGHHDAAFGVREYWENAVASVGRQGSSLEAHALLEVWI
jgi:hypothetical protein